METTTTAVVSSSEMFCECGKDHRMGKSRRCPVFEIISSLSKKIEEFLDILQIAELGEYGPMAECLRTVILSKHDDMIQNLRNYENDIKDHPEWCLTGDVSRLRRYYDQVARPCVEYKQAFAFRPSIHVLTKQVEVDETALRNAKEKTLSCYMDCGAVLREYMSSGKVPLNCAQDTKEYLSRVDRAFKKAFEAIILLPNKENSSMQALMEKSYEIWKESRRLLCGFKRRPKTTTS